MSGFVTRAPALGLTVRSTPPRSRRAVAAAAVGRWVMLLVALAGLFAMHGLSDHGAGAAVALPHSTASAPTGQAMEHAVTADGGPAAASVVGAFGMAHAAHPASGPASGAESKSDAVGLNDKGAGHDGHGGILVGVCLAVMAAVLLLGGWVAWRSRLASWARGVRFDLIRASATAIRARARGPGAPDLRLLSVQRC